MVFSIIIAIISNLITLFGVLWFGWNIGWLLVLYGIENFLIGIFNIKKIQMASAKPQYFNTPNKDIVIKGSININMSINGKTIKKWGSKEFILFFLIFYGLLNLTFITLIILLLPFEIKSFWTALLWLISVVVQHWILLNNYLENYEYQKYTKAQQTLLPFIRILTLGLPVILGLSFYNSNSFLVSIVIIGSKTLIEILLIFKPSMFLTIKYGDSEETISS